MVRQRDAQHFLTLLRVLDELLAEDESGKKPGPGAKASPEQPASSSEKPKKAGLEIEIPEGEVEGADEGDSKLDEGEEGEEPEFFYVGDKRFRKIQIEGEDDDFLMDDEGNIYDMNGNYIGTANQQDEEEEEEGEGTEL